ncbi:putative FAD-linked oxidoreductase [Ruegeria denitrificans]|uniref:Putative FAD-linked oxidoreductase n=1 Tax=Ruegeria denitrificans TaxID=1715692 RepID=A0A0P1ICH3_9RHOB|nr:FAD-binding oxidoreductase [Ruegeria denitrificans]CUK04989.1 putative FAD-linked oxidoreductase [Ruegeria denitrificans]
MTLTPADETLARLIRADLGDDILRPVTERYLEEPRRRFAGHAGLLALPRTVDEVSTLVRLAADKRVPVVPYGGGTGLVGGQVMPDGPAPLVISLERMTAIRAVYPTENTLIAEAGAILADVQAAAEEANRLFPLALAAQGSCRIGGNLATNAGGVNVLRYGNARDLCLGLEAVLPSGEIWHGLSRLRKDNTGYDLRNLLIGAEGTLGIITAASLKLHPRPEAVGTAMLQVASPQAAIDLLSLAHDQLGDGVSTFELIHKQGLQFLTEVLPDVRQPFATQPKWCVLIELGLFAGHAPADALETLYIAADKAGLVGDAVIAQSEAQRMDLWAVRERIPEANRLIGSVSSHDISVPISRIPEFIQHGAKVVAGLGPFRINCFGHLGDGNLHYNVFPPLGRNRSEFDNERQAVKHAVHDLVDAFDGSVSAEHGVGRLKVEDIERYGDATKLSAMRAIKAALDPQGIMNPGAVLKP